MNKNKLIKQWQTRLDSVNRSLDEWKGISERVLVSYDTKVYCNGKIASKTEYKLLIESTIKELGGKVVERKHEDIQSS